MPSVFADAPLLCGHRGMGRGTVDGHAENTLGSFRAAVAAGLRWVEMDARTTADAVLVARHDPTTPDGRFVARMSAAATDELGLARVAELLEELPPEVGVDIDLKTSLEDALRPRGSTTAALVAELARREARRRPLVVSSFDPAAVGIVQELAPEVPVGWLTWDRFPLREAIPAAAHLGVDVLVGHVGTFTLAAQGRARGEREPPESIAVAHDAGLEVAAWCPGTEETELLFGWGLDCAIVDAPVIAAHATRPPGPRRTS